MIMRAPAAGIPAQVCIGNSTTGDLGAGALFPRSYFQRPLCRLVKRLRPCG